MANDFFNASGYPATRAEGSSSAMRAQLAAIAAAFDKLAPLTGNGGKFLRVNAGATGYDVSSVLSESGGNVSITGTTTLAELAVTGRLSTAAGGVTFSVAPTYAADPASGNVLARKSYVDSTAASAGAAAAAAAVASYLPLAGGSMAGALLIALGSAAAPGLAIAGDSNTGFWSPGADTIAASVAGGEALRLNSTGLGIGVAPAAKLDVGTTAASRIRWDTSSAAQVVVTTSNAAGAAFLENINDALNFQWRRSGSGSDYIRFDGSGLGIWVNPVYKVDALGGDGNGYRYSNGTQQVLFGTSSARGAVGTITNDALSVLINSAEVARFPTTGGLVINAPASGYALDATGGSIVARFLNNAGGAVNAGIAFGSPGSSNLSAGVAGLAQSATTGALILQYVTGGALTEGARLDTSGQLGIGVAPTSLLDVSKAGMTIRARLRAAAGFASILSICGNNTTAEVTSFDLQMDSAGSVDIVQRNNARMSLYTNATERMRLSDAGQLYANAIHNNASGASGTTPMIASGTYTPTLTASSNVTAATPNGTWHYKRVGNIMLVSGSANITVTSASSGSGFYASLPVASNLTASTDLNGLLNGSSGGDSVGSVSGDTAADRASLSFVSGSVTGIRTMFCMFTYEIK